MMTFPNELMCQIHDRMPMILKRSEYDRWLDPGDPERLPIDLLRPYDSELIKIWTVGTNKTKDKNGIVDSPDLLQPAPPIDVGRRHSV
jgi:putative SOS response-associated peptidase YedK